MQPEPLQVDAHDVVGIERLAECLIVDPRVLVEPAGHLLLADDLRLPHVLVELGVDERREFPGRSGVAELEFDDRATDNGYVLPLESGELGRHVGRLDEIGDGEKGRAAAQERQGREHGEAEAAGGPQGHGTVLGGRGPNRAGRVAGRRGPLNAAWEGLFS